MNEYKKQKLNILLCGSFEPTFDELDEMYKKGELSIKDKMEKRIPLRPMERILHLKNVLIEQGNEVILGYRDLKGDIENVFQRIIHRMSSADFIIILLENYGGVVVEHTISNMMRGINEKTVNLIDKKSKLSGVISKGTLLLRRCQSFEYDNDLHMTDLATRVVDTFKAEKFIMAQILK